LREQAVEGLAEPRRRAQPPLDPLGVAACGGDKKDSGLSTSTYIARADRLCKPSPAGPQTQDPKVSARFLREKLIPFRKRTLANLRKLEPNADLKPRVERYLSTLEGVTVLIGRQADALDAGDRVEAGNLDVQISQGQAQRNKAAAEVGYKRCGQPISGPPVTKAGLESPAVLKAGDAACKRATDAILATKPKDFRPPTLAASVEKTLPEQKRALGVLQGLRGQAKRPLYTQFVTVEEQRYAQIRKIVAAGKANDQTRFDQLQTQDGALYAKGQPMALRLGFTVCGVSSAVGF